VEDEYEVAKRRLQEFKKKIGLNVVKDDGVKGDDDTCVHDYSLKVRA
jgi:hypothetical protein